MHADCWPVTDVVRILSSTIDLLWSLSDRAKETRAWLKRLMYSSVSDVHLSRSRGHRRIKACMTGYGHEIEVGRWIDLSEPGIMEKHDTTVL